MRRKSQENATCFKDDNTFGMLRASNFLKENYFFREQGKSQVGLVRFAPLC